MGLAYLWERQEHRKRIRRTAWPPVSMSARAQAIGSLPGVRTRCSHRPQKNREWARCVHEAGKRMSGSRNGLGRLCQKMARLSRDRVAATKSSERARWSSRR